MRIFGGIRAALLFVAIGLCPGQQTGVLRFEVASVKPASPDLMQFLNGGPGTNDPDQVLIVATLRNLIGGAYREEFADRISGPSWLESHFVVKATLRHGSSEQQFHEMTKTLLAERFGLKFHTTVSGDSPAFELVLDAKGAKINPDGPAGAVGRNQSNTGPARSNGLTRAGSSEPAEKWKDVRLSDGNQLMTFRKCSMAYLADRLSSSLSSHKIPVIDRTGLAGEFDFQFEYPTELLGSFSRDDPFGRLRMADPTFLGLASPLLTKQLGLRLRPIKVELKNMVIDHLERQPTDN